MPRLFGGKRIKPLRCPFCGGKASILSEHPSMTRFPHHVECDDCKARSAGCKESVLAVLKWNERVEPQRVFSRVHER